ncbi:unnamed protein product [Anisakis simplex]|uniref:Ovule protein n=1 Tax=Anisakis simplex TaxID=6269 RepID=A0A0M3JNN4_ANISI|nr:unnamed protein product [Anisakis simplex]
MKLNIDTGEGLKTWRFSAMKKWHVNWEIRHLKVSQFWRFMKIKQDVLELCSRLECISLECFRM